MTQIVFGILSNLLSRNSKSPRFLLIFFVFIFTSPLFANIKIAAWNVQNFGTTKEGRTSVISYMAANMNDYDIVFTQEFSTSDTGPSITLETALKALDPSWTNVIPAACGDERGHAYYKNTVTSVTATGCATGGAMARPPTMFDVVVAGNTFQVFNVHTSPGAGVQNEINNEIPAYINASASDPEDEIVVLGDYNADTCNGYYDLTWGTFTGNITLPWTAPGAIPNGANTNVTSSSCTYDRITYSNAFGAFAAGPSGVDYMAGPPPHVCTPGEFADIDTQCNAEAWGNCSCGEVFNGLIYKVSDHHLVWMELNIGGGPLAPTVSDTNPTNTAANVPWNTTNIEVIFSEAMDVTSFGATSMSCNNGASVTGFAGLTNANRTANFTVTMPAAVTTHTCTVVGTGGSPPRPRDINDSLQLVGNYVFNFTTVDPSAATGALVISEVGTGSSDRDYIQLYNGTGAPVNLTGYTLFRDNCNLGNGWTESLGLGSFGTLGTGRYLLIAEAGPSPYAWDLQWGGSGHVANNYVIALTDNGGAPVGNVPTGANVTDWVSIGGCAALGEGGTNSLALGSPDAIKRMGACKETDTDNNAADWQNQPTMAPENSSSAPCGAGGAALSP